MHVVITDLFTGDCEFTGKSNVECVRVQFDESEPEAVIACNQLVRVLRFRKTLLTKQSPASRTGDRS
jgi:hypothetical protein